MSGSGFAVVLRERLGDPTYEALEEMIQARQAHLLTIDHFERRLGEELGKLRVEFRTEMGDLKSELRAEMGDLKSELRAEMGGLKSELRGEMGDLKSELRGDMHKFRADFRVDMADLKAELLKWAMLFWVAQAAAVAGIVSALR
jgi:hypothetical protein